MANHSKSPADAVAIPEGFASLQDARRWESGLRKAEEALDALWAQRWIYALEALLAHPWVARVQAGPSRERSGVEIGVLISWRGEQVELESLMSNLWSSQYEGVGLLESGKALESLTDSARELEGWTRERPSMLRSLARLGSPRCSGPVVFEAGATWASIAQALEAARAAAGMERAQLAQESNDGAERSRESL